MRTYHVGLLLKRHSRGYRAVYQFARSIDSLDCEIYEYCGERETTVKAARDRLSMQKNIFLASVRAKFPDKVITSVGVTA